MAQKVKHIVFIFILAGLALPGFQHMSNLFPENELHGDFEQKPKPDLNREMWYSGRYQASFDPWLEENIGFHNGLVRINNQLDYTFFHKTHAEGVIRGRNGQLYEHAYIRAWTGKDFVGEELLDNKLRQFRFLQKHLKTIHNIDLVLVLEPGKASVYPEDIPVQYVKAEKGKSNYEYFRDRSIELGINLIDFNDWFIQIRDTIDYPLFPQQGTHWSEFAMWYAADSLISYIEETRNIQLPEVIIDSIVYSHKLESTDYDEADPLNLLFELDHGEMPYPRFHFMEDSSHTRPNVLTIADSYYWNIFNTRIPKNLFNNEAFWYFYIQVYPDSYFGNKYVQDLDIKKEVEKQDVIFFMTTERFMYMIDRGFVDDLIGFYGLNSSRNELLRIKTRILNDGVWVAELIKESDRKGLSLAEVLDQHAQFVFLTNDPETFYGTYGPEPIIKNILSDEAWYKKINESADEMGISVEQRMKDEALFILKNDHPAALAKYNRIKQLMFNIRYDSIWHANTVGKASRYFMTEEEMVRAEAEYVYQMEQKAGAK